MTATPTRVTHQDILDGTITDVDVNAANIDGIAATASMRTLGTGATQAAGGTHTHTGGTPVWSEIPSGTVDGANAAFVFAHTPSAGTLRVYRNGQRMSAGATMDYTLTTATVTFVAGNLPQTGDILLGDYSY